MIGGQLQNSPLNPNYQRTVLVVCVVLAVAVFAVFGQTLRFDFVNFDDEDYFYGNPHVTTGLTWPNAVWAFQIGYAANWHPLTWLSLMLDAQLFGTGPFGPHLTNLILHVANTVLLFLLLRRLTGTLWPCAFIAAGFAIHPLHVESVAWVSERKDVLSTFLGLLSLIFYSCDALGRKQGSEVSEAERRGNDPAFPSSFFTLHSSFSHCLALLFFALGLMSKPMLVTLPFVLLLLDYWPLKRFESSTVLRLGFEKLPFFFLSAASCVITVLAQKRAIMPEAAFAFHQRLGNASVSYVIYLGQMLYPARLEAFYPYQADDLLWWKMVLSLIFLTSVTAGVFFWRRERPALLVGWLWYLGTLVPVIGLLQVGGQMRADRYMYLPLIGVLLMITWAVREALSGWRRRPILAIAASSVLAAWMASASIQTAYWRNSESLWTHALACSPRNYVAQNNLASMLVNQGRVAEAIGRYQTALEINPNYVEAHNNLGILLARQGRTREAIGHYQRALEFKPDFVAAHVNLGNALAADGQLPEAFGHYQQALQLDPGFGEAHNDWGAILLREGRNAEALAHFRVAAELMPGNAEVDMNLGTALAALGQNDEAITCFQKALAPKPDYAKAHFNLANSYAAEGRWDEAIQHYQLAAQLMPDFTRAHYQLGVVLQGRGKFATSAAEFQKVLELDPHQVAAQNDLAWLLATCPDDQVRNGARAVELAQPAVEASRGRSPEMVDTLAAAYAEAGRFSEAVETAGRALAIAADQKKQPLADAIQTQLKFYQAGLPFRDVSTNFP